MTLSNQGTPDGGARPGKKPRVDQDIRNHPLYKTPWWRKPLKPWMFWTLFAGAAVVVVAAVVVCIALGIRLF